MAVFYLYLFFLNERTHEFYQIIDLKTKPMVTECYSIFSSNALLLTFPIILKSTYFSSDFMIT